MNKLKYIRQKDGTFKKVGSVKTRYVSLRIFRNGIWKEPLVPLPRLRITLTLDSGEDMPADIYELIEVESTMTDEAKEKLKQFQKKKSIERGEDPD
jgi:hypothetical protein